MDAVSAPRGNRNLARDLHTEPAYDAVMTIVHYVTMPVRIRQVCVLAILWISTSRVGAAHADGVADDDVWRYRTTPIALDAGVVAALPVALETGLVKGLGVGLTLGEALTAGVHASWARATESAPGWTVSHDDIRLVASAGLHHTAGRGSVGIRAGLGGVVVHETRTRIGGEDAGSQGMALERTATRLCPTGELDAVITIHLAGAWRMMLAGGPSLTRVEGELRTGWTSKLSVGWQL